MFKNLKRMMIVGVVMGLCLIQMPTYAGKPAKINYSGSGSAFLGGSYRLYTVICSDSKERKITSWKKRKKKPWCVGEASTNSCRKNQMQAAKIACQ